MLEGINQFFEHWEGLWLFVILFLELCVGVATLVILVKEWYYDKAIEEEKYRRRLKRAKKRWEEG